MEEYEKPVIDPITGLCIVTSKQACPLGYRCIDKSYDQQSDADLWKDTFLTKKERYLCVTRYFPLDNGRLNNVVENIAVIQDKESIPAGFSLVDTTFDTQEKAMKKRYLVVKMVPRFSVQEAVCEIIILSRMKKPPAGYTQFGDVSGMLLCYRRGPVPPETVKAVDPVSPSPYILQQSDITGARRPPVSAQKSVDGRRASDGRADPNATVKLKSPSMTTQTGASLARQGSRSLRLDSVVQISVVDDVPFRLGSSASSAAPSRRSAPLPNIPYLSSADIETQYGFDFEPAKQYLVTYYRNRGR